MRARKDPEEGAKTTDEGGGLVHPGLRAGLEKDSDADQRESAPIQQDGPPHPIQFSIFILDEGATGLFEYFYPLRRSSIV
jgi:hypothetical protein